MFYDPLHGNQMIASLRYRRRNKNRARNPFVRWDSKMRSMYSRGWASGLESHVVIGIPSCTRILLREL